MEKKLCKDCKCFYQHYGLGEKGFIRLHCGHCCFDKLKDKKSEQKACVHFVQGEDHENSFVRRDYLTKTLLEQVFKMDLFPEICQEAEK